jgi:hypothetical protein
MGDFNDEEILYIIENAEEAVGHIEKQKRNSMGVNEWAAVRIML